MAEEKGKDYKHIVRVANTDIDGSRQILYGMTKIKGVSVMYANAACRLAGVHPEATAGDLSDKDVEKLNGIVKEPLDKGMPEWLVNRRKDYETGDDKHILGGDIEFVEDQDIKRMKKAKTYKGIRHSQGLTARGQRTKGNFRRNKGRGPGVQKKKVKK